MIKRVLTAVVLLVPLIAILVVGGFLLKLLALAACLLINYEYFSFALPLSQQRCLQFTLLSFLLALGYLYHGFSGLTGAAVLATLIAFALLIVIKEENVHEIDAALLVPPVFLGLGYTGLLGSLLVVVTDVGRANLAIAWILAIVITSDTFGYFGGSTFGGLKLAPRISPNKTVSGAICSLVGAVLASILAGKFLGLSDQIFLLAVFGVLAGALAQLGDLAESLVKRTFGVKDAGHLLPGHGGLLDRIDALLFAAPVLLITNF